MVQATFPEIEFPSLRKRGVVLESEELRSSAIGQTSHDLGHATNLPDDEFLFDCDWRAENITFRERGRRWSTGEFRGRGYPDTSSRSPDSVVPRFCLVQFRLRAIPGRFRHLFRRKLDCSYCGPLY
jgi:hypothetical protein